MGISTDSSGEIEFEKNGDAESEENSAEEPKTEPTATTTATTVATATAATSASKSPVPNVVLFIQMEFCEKSTLRNIIDSGLYKDQERVWRLFREIVEGIGHIHHQVSQQFHLCFGDLSKLQETMHTVIIISFGVPKTDQLIFCYFFLNHELFRKNVFEFYMMIINYNFSPFLVFI